MTSQNKGRTPPPFKECKFDKTGENEKKLWKLFWERKCRFTKTIALPKDETKTSENLQNERIINVYHNASVSNMPDTRAHFSHAIFSKLWNL